MTDAAFFSVDTRLASLLGEAYRSTEAALKELVDNAWDADADNVWVTLPGPMSTDPIVIRDDGLGMSPTDVSKEYLTIARDRRSRKGQRSLKYKRRIKGRKGIGKFAGLAAARMMRVETVSGGKRSTVDIDKNLLLEATDDLEKIPLPMEVVDVGNDQHGTTITLSSLNQTLNFPKEEAMRAALVHEYGREHGFRIFVNGSPLTVEDVLGPSQSEEIDLPSAGRATFRLTIAEGNRTPRHPGIVLKVGGKVVGKPMMFGLDSDAEIPGRLLKRIYGEVEVDNLEDHVTADWGAVLENSKPFAELQEWVLGKAREALNLTYKREIDLQKARLKRDLDRRLERLPEHRRVFAERALERLLLKFYGERPDRVEAVANVVLDAMERDEYWLVLEKMNAARHSDVATFSEALEQFGLLELALVAERARYRSTFLDDLDLLAANPATQEKELHRAIENSLWVLGGRYQMMASNRTLKRVVEEYCDREYKGDNANRRPDLLLAGDSGERYLLIEFKRPSHPITRQDEAQARTYRDELAKHLPAKAIDIIVLGGRRIDTADTRYDTPDTRVLSYNDVIAQARHDLDWLIRNLSGGTT